jgi:hypothetical protein
MIGNDGATLRIRINAPQSKLWIVTWRPIPARFTSAATTCTNSSRGAVSSGAPASTLVSMLSLTVRAR